MSIGKRIKKFRKKMNYTQGELARRCGWGEVRINSSGRTVDKGQLRISSYENGYRQPPVAAILLISHILKISVKSLILENSQKNNTKSIDKDI